MALFPTLFSSGRIGTMETRNRLVMAPMVRNYADEQGRVTPRYLAHIARIARGGVGMMTLEASFVRPDGKGFTHELGLHDDAVIPGLQELVRAAHEHGVKIGPQIFHAGRQTSSAVTGMMPVAPSALPDPTTNEMPRALSVAEIHDIVGAFAQGARRAKEAGCDFAEIHGAHGYLITQFLSSFSNVRDDDYGGSFEGRLRLLVEIIEAVRSEVGLDFPLSVRLSGEEMVPGGLTLDDTVEIARRLEALRIDALSISAGNYASYTQGMMISPMVIPDAPLLPLAAGVKAAVRIPVMVTNKIRWPDEAEAIVRDGKADFIGLGRVLLADPDWPQKAAGGRLAEIDKCIACNQGCISRLFAQQDVWCTVNPETSREMEFSSPPPERPLRVLVAGGGPAGMEAAKVARSRRHQVVLCEATDHLGGQLVDAATPPHRPGWAELRGYLTEEMTRLGIEVRLHTKVTPEMVQREHVDAVIVATGSTPNRLKIPGTAGEKVVTARDLLEGKVTARGRVVIAGGGCSGAQTAEYLAVRGHKVTIVEMQGEIAGDAPSGERELLLARLNQLGVQIQRETKILRVEPEGVVVQRPGGVETMPADTVVLCLGSYPNDELVESLNGSVDQILVVGDALKPRRVTEAIEEGALSVLQLKPPRAGAQEGTREAA